MSEPTPTLAASFAGIRTAIEDIGRALGPFLAEFAAHRVRVRRMHTAYHRRRRYW